MSDSESRQVCEEIDAAIQPLLALEAKLRKVGHSGDAKAMDASINLWQAIKLLQAAIVELEL